VNFIHVAQDTRRALLTTVINIRVPGRAVNILTTSELVRFSKGTPLFGFFRSMAGWLPGWVDAGMDGQINWWLVV
jgi:hypothetical protein